MDCLIVAIAEEHGLAVLHVDRDFNPLLRLTGVDAVPLAS
jgi:predicted nucleic acid-binding protein